MRRAAKIDTTQPAIVKAYRSFGCKVYPTHTVGDDFPDLVVCNYGLTWTVECKTGNAKPMEGQQRFADECKGAHFIVRDLNGVAMSLNVMRDKANRLI